MPDNESQEIQEKNTLTNHENESIINKILETHTKFNDYYLKRREPLKEDPVFEEFDKIDKMRD